MKPIGKTLVLLLILHCSSAMAQSTNVFIIKFEEKENKVNAEEILSKKAIDRRLKFGIKLDELDYPVNSGFVSTILKDTSILLRYTLKWQNAAVVSSDTQSLEHLKKMDFVKNVLYVGKADKISQVEKPTFQSPRIKLKESIMETQDLTVSDYGASFGQNNQIGIIELHRKGLNGSGVHIAIFDAGFKNINSIPSFLKHQANGKLTYGYDIAGLDNELNNSDNHGTSCVSCFGAYDKGKYIGSAPLANVILFRTEFAATEYPVEELNWCKAAELADSIGADMITSSLGYNRFDDKSLSYTHRDLNGNTSFISKSATIAVTKGIVVLNSAGNEGDNEWRKIGTPADVPSVITVGAVGLDNIPGRFSSKGYNADGIVKPDVSACGVLATVASPNGGYYQGYGTSYATPIAAGGVACLLQAFPSLSPNEIANLVRTTATQANHPDSSMGYGVAQFDLAYNYQTAKNSQNELAKVLKIDDHQVVIYAAKSEKIDYELFYIKKILGVFNIKKSKTKGTNAEESDLRRIYLNPKTKDCSKKYTLKIIIKTSVDNESLIFNDLSLCPL